MLCVCFYLQLEVRRPKALEVVLFVRISVQFALQFASFAKFASPLKTEMPPQEAQRLSTHDGFGEDNGISDDEDDHIISAQAASSPFDSQSEESQDFKEYARLRPSKAIESSMFERDFVQFCRWLRAKVHAKHPASTFRDINRHTLYRDLLGYAFIAVAYWTLWFVASSYTWVWSPPLFVAALYVYRREQLVHARMHYIRNMTGVPLLDRFVDASLIILTGISVQAFYRRHIDEHLSFISNHARVFGSDWQPFDDLPAVFWAKPWSLFRVALDADRCKRDGFHRGHLLWEGIAVHLYLAAVIGELYVGRSCYLFAFHLVPYLITVAARLTTGMLTHSGLDSRNSFNSCGLFDHRTARGLFRIMVLLINTLSDDALSAHPIHHGYSQAPLATLQPILREVNDHCRATYRGVRYNTVLSHVVHENLLARLPPPRWYHYPVQAAVDVAALALSAASILGASVPPILLELAIVDYRVYAVSTKEERAANIIALWDSLRLTERARAMSKHNSYLTFVLRNYAAMKETVRTAAVPVKAGRKAFGPAFVYEEMGLPIPEGAE